MKCIRNMIVSQCLVRQSSLELLCCFVDLCFYALSCAASISNSVSLKLSGCRPSSSNSLLPLRWDQPSPPTVNEARLTSFNQSMTTMQSAAIPRRINSTLNVSSTKSASNFIISSILEASVSSSRQQRKLREYRMH